MAKIVMTKLNELGKRLKTHQIQTIDMCYGWEELPDGPLVEVAQRLSNFEDFEALHLVCTRWTSLLRASQCKFFEGGRVNRRQVPWLMMAENEGVEVNQRFSLRPCSSKGKSVRVLFYNLSFQRVREMVIRLPPVLEEVDFKNSSLYSSHGWLLVMTKGSKMSLYNPLLAPTHNYIPLPGHCILARCARRFTLSASPCTKRYTVLVVYGHTNVAFWMPGNERWTLVESPYFSGISALHPYLDVVFYRGYCYTLNQIRGISRLCSLEDIEHFGKQGVGDDEVRRTCNWTRRDPLFLAGNSYLYLWKAYFVVVESPAKLLVVVREGLSPLVQPNTVLDNDHLTAGFRVTEIVGTPMVSNTVTREVKSLGNISLFVGRNQAFAVEVPHSRERFNVNPSDSEAKNPAASSYYGCKPNCIYFTDDRFMFDSPTTAECGKGKDMGVYNMADGSIERHFQGLSLDGYSPMLWV